MVAANQLQASQLAHSLRAYVVSPLSRFTLNTDYKKERAMQECELLETCGFFQKYRDTLNLACRGFIKTYCAGDKVNECKRKEFRRQHGNPPVDDMLPSGQMMPSTHKA